ncbi:hypothetical protein DCC39_05090 [Pueribacillus theae]|uniref:Cupin type-1 domain-containing protein n=1 Tax=Pueribacillus theae TaxID=2171751 RepID=A0A2U1K524_9BACI|nr:cupin domain-containing protein [Pueribacillus theae]PWA12600.1 hypothetical protein DCC39_05090 [Pueribacillus theae]
MGAPNLFLKNRAVFFQKNSKNVIFEVTSAQLPVLNRIGLDDLFLTKGHIQAPHWHPNAAELNYVAAGEAMISVLDPLRHRLLSYHVKRGQVVYIPINWWHWVSAISDKVHIVQTFSNADRQIIEGPDVLKKTPPEVFQLAYGVDAKAFAKLLAPITERVVIGPENPHLTEELNMMGNIMPSSSPILFFDLRQNLSVRRDDSLLFKVTCRQIPLMHDLSLGDLFLTKGHIREPHWHPNADEFDYIISGQVTISILNPFTLQLISGNVQAGQVVFIPKGWWHWIIPVTEKTHLLVFFNDGKIESVEGSDVLRLTPPRVYEQAYGINAEKLDKELTSIRKTLTIGPPSTTDEQIWF